MNLLFFVYQIYDLNSVTYYRTGQVVQAINIPAQVLGSVAWGGVNLDILFVTTYSSVRNINTGENDKNFKFTNGSGQVFMVNGLNARGVPGRPACV